MGATVIHDMARGRIRDLALTNDYIDFHHLPNEITEELEVTWDEQTIIGRMAPHIGYANTGARIISLNLHFHAENSARDEVIKKTQWLQSLKYPEYVGTFMKPPHEVRLVIGKFINLRGVIQTASVTYMAPWDINTTDEGIAGMYPMQATVDLSIREVVKVPYSYGNVRNSYTIGSWRKEKAEASGS